MEQIKIIQVEETKSEKNNNLAFRIFDKIIGVSILMLFFGLPLYFTNLTLQGLVFEKQMYFYFWVLVGLIFWAAKSVIVGEMNIKRTPLDFPLLGFWLAYLLATIFSVDKWHSFFGSFSDPSRGLMSITVYIVGYYLIVSNFNTKRLKVIFVATIISNAGLALWTTLAIFGVKFLPEKILAYAPISLAGSITSLGIIFSCMIPFLAIAVLKLAEREDLGRLKKNSAIVFIFITMVLNLFLILALYNYVPWLGFFAGISIFFIFILAKIMRPKPNWVWVPVVLFILVMALRMIGGNISLARINLPVELSLDYNTSKDIAIESAKDNFFVGSGPATYGYNFSLNRPKDFNLNAFYNLRFYQGTGILAESLPTIGVIGIFFLLLLVFSYIGSQFYLLAKNKERNKLYSLGIFSVAIILIIDVLSVQVSGTILSLMVIFTALSLANLLFESEIEEKNYSLTLKASPKFALAFAFVFMVICVGATFFFVYLGKIYIADIYMQKAKNNIAQDSLRAIDYLGKAINLNSREAQYFTQIGEYYMALANQEAMKGEDSRDISMIQKYLNASIAAANQGKNMNKNDVGAVESLALIYENAGLYVTDSMSLADENYKRALELEPHNAIYFLKQGQIKINSAQNEKDPEKKKQLASEAKDLFQKSIDEKKDYTEGYYQLALTQEALGELDQAIENNFKAIQLNRGNINYFISLGRMYQTRGKDDDIKIAEQSYQEALKLNDKDVNARFYLGLFYENIKKKDEAKIEYNKIIDLLQTGDVAENNKDVIEKLRKMIDNLEKGIENTPENLGLVQASENTETPPVSQPENAQTPEESSEQPMITPEINNTNIQQ